MPTPSPDHTTEDGLFVYEAPTAEEALARVTDELGPGARIVDASKALSGGVGGFFAREVVRLRVEPPADAAPTGPHPMDGLGSPTTAPATTTPAAATDGRTAVEALLDRLAADDAEGGDGGDGDDGESFGDYLRRHLDLTGTADPVAGTEAPASLPERSVAGTHPTTSDVPPAPRVLGADAYRAVEPVSFPRHERSSPGPVTPPAAARAEPDTRTPSSSAAASPRDPSPSTASLPTTPDPAWPVATGPEVRGEVAEGAPLWSAATLTRIGLPESLVARCGLLDPADDAAWISTIAAAVAPSCRPLPAGAAVFAGPEAGRVAAALDLPTVTPPDPIAAAGAVAAVVSGSARDQGWLAWARHGRYVHLVAGGDGWRPLLFGDPAAISWVGADALPLAVSFALRLGLVLGYDVAPSGRSSVRRANAVDVALAIRDLVPRR